MGQAETASLLRPFVAGHLQDTVSLGNEGAQKKTYVSSCLFQSTLGEERLRPQVSVGDTYFARDTYPNRFAYYPSMPHDLTEQVSKEYKQPIT
jgi:hypothetical protein